MCSSEKLHLPCCSLSWCTSRCNSAEPHRPSPANAGLHIAPEIQSWAFNSFCPTLGYQETEESRRPQQEPAAATTLDSSTPPATRHQPRGGRYHRGDRVSSSCDRCSVGCRPPLATPEALPNTLLRSAFGPASLGQPVRCLRRGPTPLTSGLALPNLTCQRSEASSSDSLKRAAQCWAPTKHPVGSVRGGRERRDWSGGAWIHATPWGKG